MFNMRYALTGALLLIGSATVASAQRPTQHQTKPGMHAGARRGMMAARRLRGQLFKGITLSDAEKSNIKSVRAKYAPQMKALREQMKPQLKAARDARQRGDSAALKDLWQKSSAQREQAKQLMLAQQNDIRAALTPANQATFDANAAALKKRIAERAKNGAKHPRMHAPAKALR